MDRHDLPNYPETLCTSCKEHTTKLYNYKFVALLQLCIETEIEIKKGKVKEIKSNKRYINILLGSKLSVTVTENC
jgi:hypothetical protein